MFNFTVVLGGTIFSRYHYRVVDAPLYRKYRGILQGTPNALGAIRMFAFEAMTFALFYYAAEQ